jgi:hypothetical protein
VSSSGRADSYKIIECSPDKCKAGRETVFGEALIDVKFVQNHVTIVGIRGSNLERHALEKAFFKTSGCAHLI